MAPIFGCNVRFFARRLADSLINFYGSYGWFLPNKFWIFKFNEIWWVFFLNYFSECWKIVAVLFQRPMTRILWVFLVFWIFFVDCLLLGGLFRLWRPSQTHLKELWDVISRRVQTPKPQRKNYRLSSNVMISFDRLASRDKATRSC